MTDHPQPVLHATTSQGEKITLRPAESGDIDAIMVACAERVGFVHANAAGDAEACGGMA